MSVANFEKWLNFFVLIIVARSLNSSRDFLPIHWQEAKGIFRKK